MVEFVRDLNLNTNELQNAVIQNLSSAPLNPKEGQIYYNTVSNYFCYWNGTVWISIGSPYVLPPATETTLGGVIVPTNGHIEVDEDGNISVAIASTTEEGLIKIALDTDITTGTDESKAVNPKQLKTVADTKVNKNADITGGTHTKITYDEKGLVTSGEDLEADDIPDISETYVTQAQLGVASEEGGAVGVATLGTDGKVPTSQLPSYVDDVIETYTRTGETPLSSSWLSLTEGGEALTPETGKIYVVLSTGEYLNKTFRWGGTTYVEISSAPVQATEASAGIAMIATQSDTNTGTNDTKIVTPLKLTTMLSSTTLVCRKNTYQNDELTGVGGVCTWTITHNLGKVIAQMYEVATGNVVYADMTVTNNTVVVKINATSVDEGTYEVLIQG